MGGVGSTSGDRTRAAARASAGGSAYGRGPGGAAGSSAARGNPSGLSTEYEADNPQVMPVYNSPQQIEAAKRKALEISGRSGRTSTNLVGNPGTRAYTSSFLGSVT